MSDNNNNSLSSKSSSSSGSAKLQDESNFKESDIYYLEAQAVLAK